MSDDEFLAAFESQSLLRSQWTHEAHVRMAWLYLGRYSLPESIVLARTGIQKLNARYTRYSCSPRRHDQGGYHDTITVAFVRLIASRLESGEAFPAFCSRNPDLLDRTLSALLNFYSKERLHSPAAKQEFIEPDLSKLPV